MKSLTKKWVLVAVTFFSLSAFAEVIDFRPLGGNRFCPGDTLSHNLSGKYVERIMISAEGVGRDGFIKVYVDGELVHNIGVPGYDPDYSFRVRRNVNHLSLKFERTCSRIRDFKIFTETNVSGGGVGAGPDIGITPWPIGDSWGWQLLNLVNSMSEKLVIRSDFDEIWTSLLLPLKKLALAQGVRDSVRDPRSLKTAYFSLKIAKKISDEDASDLLDNLLECSDLDSLVRGLRTLKEDILEKMDVRERNLGREIKGLEEALEM